MDIYEILRVNKNVNITELQEKYARLVDVYIMTVEFAENQEVADIAKLKLEQLLELGKKHGLNTKHSQRNIVYSLQNEINIIKLALNSSASDYSKLKGNDISGRIDKLPECGEKHYLKAIVHLRINSDLQGCKNAVEELHKAIKCDSTNEAYRGLIDAIAEQIEEYERRHIDFINQQEQERQEQEKLSQRAVIEAQRRQFLSSAAPCIGGMVSIGGIVIAGWCICGCCKSMCSC